MLHSCNALHGSDKLQPCVALLCKHLAAGGGELVIAAAALPALLHPAALDPAALLQPVKQRIKRGDVETNGPAGLVLNELADLIAVARPRLQQGEDQQLGATLFQFAMKQGQ